MKHTVYGILLAVIALLVVAILLGVSGKNVRENEIETALNTAIEQALEQWKEKESDEAGDVQGMIADFNRLLLQQVESNSEIQVDVLTADAKKGVMDVRVTNTYRNILGQERKIVCRKSVIQEEYTEEMKYYTITFFVDGQVYDQYSLYQGGQLVAPKTPKKDGKTFRYWVKNGESQECVLEQESVENDLILEAVFQ